MSAQGILNVKKRYCAEGLQLKDKPRPGQPKKLDSRGEQYLIALACSPAPEGREVWTMQMLAEARRLTQRFEFHDTPIHDSWLNMAELELSVISRQCLHRRIDSLEKLTAEAQAWATDRNARKQSVTCCFTTKDARRRLERFYGKN